MTPTVPTAVRGRFVRSVRLGSASATDLDGYLPTARALDVVRRVVRGMSDPAGTRAFSITGPYGSGKSSLAVFLDALCGPTRSSAYAKAVALLEEHDPETAAALLPARAAMGVPASGMARAIVTAPQREAVTTTVLRALANAAAGYRSSQDLREQIASALARATDDRLASPSFHEIRDLIVAITASRPVLVVIDEFGKNLEAYSESGADGDLYLLQELAEWASSAEGRLPLVVVTIQHLAFESYAAADSVTKRREWAKVQGRFEDIPFVDSAAATRALIASAMDHGDNTFFDRIRGMAAAQAAAEAAELGLPEIAVPQRLAATWPLHPTTLLVLPELCARYGQNERTLFSFLASPEPRSVTSWLAGKPAAAPLGWVRLPQVYDYFVESASNFLALSEDGSRWTEVSTAIRDSHGLSDAQLRVLKAVGVLNLVASTGTLRASHGLVGFACADGRDGTRDADEVQARLDELVAFGLITFRDFAQEYRIWRGSDFDINAALSIARRSAAHDSLASLLSTVRPMRPLVAAGHSTRTGTVRAFARAYADRSRPGVTQPRPREVCDGVVVYRLDDVELAIKADNGSPVVVIDAHDNSAVRGAAVELAALLTVAEDPAIRPDDHAARRELSERIAYARLNLDQQVTAAFGQLARWRWLNPPQGGPRDLEVSPGTTALSDVLDEAYAKGPERIAYEAINRSELTSAGARARRILQASIVSPASHRRADFGLQGEGAEVAMYRALILDPGIHAVPGLREPDAEDWKPVWSAARDELLTEDQAVSAEHLLNVMMGAPYGLREGTASVLLTALLVVEAKRLAVYEHGTFQPKLTAAVVERLVRNPRNFALRHLSTAKQGQRWALLKELNRELNRCGLGSAPEQITVLSTVQRLAGTYQEAFSTYVSRTRRFHGVTGLTDAAANDAAAVRDALTEAREPDVLLFESLPAALGMPPISNIRGKDGQAHIKDLAKRCATSVATIAQANEALALAVYDRVTLAAIPEGMAGSNDDRDSQLREMEQAALRLASIDTVTQDVRAMIQACLMNPASPVELGTQIATTVTGVSPRDWPDRSLHRYLTQLDAAARGFRRLSDLARARDSQHSGGQRFDAFAISITTADGRTIDTTSTLDDTHRGQVEAALDLALNAIDTPGLDPVAALLAALAGRTMTQQPDDRTVEPGSA